MGGKSGPLRALDLSHGRRSTRREDGQGAVLPGFNVDVPHQAKILRPQSPVCPTAFCLQRSAQSAHVLSRGASCGEERVLIEVRHGNVLARCCRTQRPFSAQKQGTARMGAQRRQILAKREKDAATVFLFTVRPGTVSRAVPFARGLASPAKRAPPTRKPRSDAPKHLDQCRSQSSLVEVVGGPQHGNRQGKARGCQEAPQRC
mmetsp:Transcript_33328/g.66710  ORF Transcript_33328/g.66710 Transcript_33328/m.66710 type:complete len:203 (+) Transcript_33328:314-922(+)